MEVRLILKATGFLCLAVVGAPANLCVLLLFFRLRLTHGALHPNDHILAKLAFVNLLVMLCRGIPQSMSALGVRRFLDQHGCKVIIITYRISRAMSICTTALLSCFQCMTLAPNTPRWAALKRWLPPHLNLVILLLYAINLLVCLGPIIFTDAPPVNGSIPEYTLNLEFCIVVFPGQLAYMANGMAYILRDAAFVALMVAAATYMVLMLCRHRQQMKGRGRVTGDASQAVLLLVCTYVVLFGLDNVLWIYTLCVSRVPPAVSDARVFFASCYSALSPLLMMATNRRLADSFPCGSRAKKGDNSPASVGTTVSQVTQ